MPTERLRKRLEQNKERKEGVARLLKGMTRPFIFLYQRITRGFDDSECWNLDFSLSKLILPRLKHFRNNPPMGHPNEVESFEKWLEIIDKMIFSFDCIANEKEPDMGPNLQKAFLHHNNMSPAVEQEFKEYREKCDALNAKIQEGLDLFAKYFRGLWD